jgi:hypothetical protein
MEITKIWNKFWKDKNGHIVIWQMPNIPLMAWLILTIISLFLSGHVADIFAYAGMAALFIWCLLEIFKGANYFRRLFGLTVLIIALLLTIHIS